MSDSTFRPIFIVGAPRSGTTLLRVMLNRHPAIGLCDETYYFYWVADRQKAFGDLADPANRRRLAAKYFETDRMRRLKLDLGALGERLEREGTSYDRFLAVILQFWAEVHGKSRPGEKTPHHAWNVGTLLSWYPEARVIHLVRDPRDVCASLFRVPWGRRSALANGELWVSLTQAAERAATDPRFRRLRYEDLVADPERELTALCAFLGERFVPGMLQADPTSQVDKPWFERAQGELARDRQGTWREELTPGQVQLVELAAGPLMRSMGYETSAPPAPATARLLGRMHERAEDLKERIRRAPRIWYHWFQPMELAAEESWVDR
jgi:hypothetical protein